MLCHNFLLWMLLFIFSSSIWNVISINSDFAGIADKLDKQIRSNRLSLIIHWKPNVFKNLSGSAFQMAVQLTPLCGSTTIFDDCLSPVNSGAYSTETREAFLPFKWFLKYKKQNEEILMKFEYKRGSSVLVHIWLMKPLTSRSGKL